MYIDKNLFESQKWFCPCVKRGDKECGMGLECKATGGLCKMKHCPFVHWARYTIGVSDGTDRNKGDSVS